MDFLEQFNKINSLKPFEMHNYFVNLTFEEKEMLVNNPYLCELNNNAFKGLFTNFDSNYLIKLLDNNEIYHRLMSMSFDKMSLRFFRFLNPSVYKKIVEDEKIVNYHQTLEAFFKSLTAQEFRNLLDSDVNYKNFTEIYDKQYLMNKYHINDPNNNILNLFYSKSRQGLINPIAIFNLVNYKEFIVYTRFGLIINDNVESKFICLNNGFMIPLQALEDIKEGPVNKIINMLKEKDSNINPQTALEIALKLYYCFGYDVSKKILEDKFFNVTDLVINRISDFSFKIYRQQYRLNNPDEFYHHNMIDKVLSGDKSIYNALCFGMNSSEIQELINEFTEIMLSKSNVREKIETRIKELIDKREEILKNEFYYQVSDQLNKKENNCFDIRFLNKLLLNIDVNLVRNYSPKIQEKIIKVLFGNTRKDNDCLFRIISLNKAKGITVAEVVNNIELLVSLSEKKQISLENILDISNVLRMNRFNLAPNEKDISLDTLTKIINCKQFCSIEEQELIEKILKLHVDRKNKNYSTIPIVSGEVDSVKYDVAFNDSDELLAAGIDGKCCFKIGGLGEDLFRYCLKNPNGAVIYLTDEDSTRYICPVVRSGNGIHCNGIDPEFPVDRQDKLLNALEKCFQEMIKKSYKNPHEPIEVATITNLHINTSLDKEIYDLEVGLPYKAECYNDFNKAITTNYILAKSKTYFENHYYLPKTKYFYPRTKVYEFSKLNGDSISDEVMTMINSIAYTMIDYEKCEDMASLKRNFTEYKKEDFLYVSGNKDWFVAVDNNYDIVNALLPYKENQMAAQEYSSYYNKVLRSLKKGDLSGKTRKNL